MNDNQKNFYDSLVKAGFQQNVGDYNTFSKNFADDNKRHNLYNNLVKKGWDLVDYDQFSSLFGYGSVQAPQDGPILDDIRESQSTLGSKSIRPQIDRDEEYMRTPVTRVRNINGKLTPVTYTNGIEAQAADLSPENVKLAAYDGAPVIEKKNDPEYDKESDEALKRAWTYSPNNSKDLSKIYHDAYSGTKEGDNFAKQIREVQNQVNQKYSDEFRNTYQSQLEELSDKYFEQWINDNKEAIGKLRAESKTEEELNKKTNDAFNKSELGQEYQNKVSDLFDAAYRVKINDEMQPYYEAYEEAFEKRYGESLRKKDTFFGQQKLQENRQNIENDYQNLLDKYKQDKKNYEKHNNYGSGYAGIGRAIQHAEDKDRNDLQRRNGILEATADLLNDDKNINEQLKRQGLYDKTGVEGFRFADKGLNKVSWGAAWRGLKDSILDLDTWTNGLSDLAHGKYIIDTLEKVEQGKELGEEEKNLLDEVINSTAIKMLAQDQLDRGYNIGQVTGMSLPFMAEMIIGMAPIKGATSAASKGLLRYAEKKTIEAGINKSAFKAAGVAGKRAMVKEAINKGGKNATNVFKRAGYYVRKGASKGASDLMNTLLYNHTMGAAQVANEFQNRSEGIEGIQVVKDTDGEYKYMGRQTENNPLKAFAKAEASQGLETGSELLGESFGKIGSGLMTTVFGNKAVSKMSAKLAANKYMSWMKAHPVMNTIHDIRQKAEIQGAFSEYLEEVANNIGSMAIGDMSWNDVVNLEKNVDTFLGVAPMSLMFGAANNASYLRNKYKDHRFQKKIETVLRERTGKDFSQLKQLLSDASLEQTKQVAMNIMKDGKYSKETKKDALQYIASIYMDQINANIENGPMSEDDIDINKKVIWDNYIESRKAAGKLFDKSQFNELENTDIDVLDKLVNEGTITQEQEDALMDYQAAKSDFDEYSSFVDERAEAARKQAEEEIESLKNEDTGNLTRVKIGNSENPVYIKKGTIVQSEDGEGIDYQKSDNIIYYRDEEGKVKMANINAFESVVDDINGDEIKEQAGEDAARKVESDEYHSVEPEPQVGVSFQKDGKTYIYAGKNETGEYIVQEINENGIPLSIEPWDVHDINKSIETQDELLQPTQNNTTNETKERSGEETVTPEQASAGIEATTADETRQEEPQPRTLDDVKAELPKRKDGTIDFKHMTPQQSYEYTSLSDSPETALQDLKDDLSVQKDAVEKAKNTVAKAKGGERIEAREALRAEQSKLDELQAFYESVLPKQEEPQGNEFVNEQPINGIAQTETTVPEESIKEQPQNEEIQNETSTEERPQNEQEPETVNNVSAESSKNDAIPIDWIKQNESEQPQERQTDTHTEVIPEQGEESTEHATVAMDDNAPKNGEQTIDYINRIAHQQETKKAIASAEQEANTNPTDAQKEAGNYKKGHVNIDGYDITIENPKDSERSGTDRNGKKWSTKMNNTYGYIRRTESVDSDHIDIFLSDNPTSGDVYVIDQVNPETGEFDEHKVMYGFPDMESAKRAYLSNYEDGWQGLGGITEVSKDEFKKWVNSSKRKTKPFAEYKRVKTTAGKHTQLIENYAQKSKEIMRDDAKLNAHGNSIDTKQEKEKKSSAGNSSDGFTFQGIKDKFEFESKADEELFDELRKGIDETGGSYYEIPLDLLDAVSYQIPEVAQDRIMDYIDNHYPTQSTVSAKTTSPEGLKERKAMQEDKALEKLRKDADAWEKRVLKEIYSKKAELKKTLGSADATEEDVAKCYVEAARFWADLCKRENIGEKSWQNSGVALKPSERKQDAALKFKDWLSGIDRQGEIGEAEVPAPKAKIDDVGEHLEGARKDMRMEIAKTLANITVAELVEKPFGKVYKKPNLKKAVESGALREKDAIFYEALFSMINKQKPTVTQSEMRSKRYNPDYKTKVERWASSTYKAVEAMRRFMEADETERDALIDAVMKDRYPNREKELAEIEQRKEWNPDSPDHKYEWGEKTTPNPLWVTYEVMNKMGYNVGDKMDVPYGVVKANSSGTGYSVENLKGEKALLFGRSMTLDEAIDTIVYLARLKRGDSDISHPTQMFSFPSTKSEAGESGRFRVMWGSWRNTQFKEFDSKGEADAFAAKKKGAVVSPITETKRTFGYKVRFNNPLTGEKYFVDDAEFETKDEALAYFDGNFEKLNDATNAKLEEERGKTGEKKQLTADDVVCVSMVHGNDGWKYAVLIDKKYANNGGEPYVIRESFENRNEAKAFADSIKADVLKTVQKHKEDRKKIVYFDTGENSRIGEDYRGGKDMGAEDFMNTFGFRGVQFGNWTNQTDRQMAINQAYDAFMDMAKLIGVSPKAMSLNGELGIAFGARGVGGFAAHYEPGEVVINLTKTEGAGSLAHEWWHALDNYFSRSAGSPSDMVTDNRSIAMREELRKAFNDMLDLVKGSDYSARSHAQGEYWGRTREITARLLAEWVDQELKKRGELNTFLSRGVAVESGQRVNYSTYEALELLAGREPMSFDEYKDTPESLKGIPYPSAKEVEQFGDAVRGIFDAIEEKVDEDSGKVALFQIIDETLRNDTEARQLATDAVLEALSRSGVPVEMATQEQADAMLSGEADAEKQIVYHGSGAKFKEFDHSHMGEGEGNQSYGWGSYVTEVEGIGKTYAKSALKERYKENRTINDLAKERLKSNGSKEAALKYLNDLLGESWVDKKRVKAQIKIIETGRFLPEGNVYLYSVDIPTDGGENYLDYTGIPTEGQLSRIGKQLESDEWVRTENGILSIFEREGRKIVLNAKASGADVYKELETAFDSDEKASRFLKNIGIVGVSYPAQYRNGGREDGARNYVIFDEKDLRIIDHVQFMRIADSAKDLKNSNRQSPQGTVYGWTVGGKIFLTQAGINPNTPIHEYTHLWANAMMQNNKKGWESIKDLLKGTPVWNEVVNDTNYTDIKDDEDAVASEALSRISGKENAAKMEREAQKMLDEAHGILDKINAASLIGRMKLALEKFWNWVGKDLFGIKKFKSIDKVTDRVLYDLVSGTELSVGGQEDKSLVAARDREYMEAVESGDMEKAQAMVNEEAERKGYSASSEYQGTSAFNGSAPYGNSYFFSKEERKQALDNDELEGDITLGDYIDNGVDINIEILIGDANYRHADAMRKEAIDNIRSVVRGKRRVIKMYRSVPSSVKEGSFRNGDWVTPSRQYAAENARIHGWGDDYRIIEQEVPVDDVWFDGNDIAEWSYGREEDFANDKDFAYRNTANNRKSLDVVTYDDRGEVIPLSKRFDSKKPDLRFQIVENTPEEEDIIERTKAEGSYMKAPNGEPTNLTEKQWVQVRTKAFKEWFGDWEKAARIEKLKKSKPVKITGKEIEPSDDLKQYKKNALEYGKKLQGNYVNKDTGVTIQLQRGRKNGGINEVLQHNYKDVEHLQSVAAIPDVIRNSIFIDSELNHDTVKNPDVREYQHFVCGLKIGDVNYTVHSMVAVDNKGNRYYDHNLTQIEKTNLLDLIESQADNEKGFGTTPGTKPTTLSGYKVKQLISILQTNSSKVLDENGEPKVVDGLFLNLPSRKPLDEIDKAIGIARSYVNRIKEIEKGSGTKWGSMDFAYTKGGDEVTKEIALGPEYIDRIVNRILRGTTPTMTVAYRYGLVNDRMQSYNARDDFFENGISVVGKVSDMNTDESGYYSAFFGDQPYMIVIGSFNGDHGSDGEMLLAPAYVVASAQNLKTVAKSATENNGDFSAENDDIRFRTVGGNSGYVGYSMSKRASEARNEGRYPKTDFKKAYGVTDKSLDALIEANMINNSEWHHTSSYGNKTIFYGWAEPWMAEAYAENKKGIDKLSKEKSNTGDIEKLMDESQAHRDYEAKQEKQKQEKERMTVLRNQYKKETEKTIPTEIETSNGAIVHTDGSSNESDWYVTKDGERMTKRNGKEIRNTAVDEVRKLLRQDITFDEWIREKAITDSLAELGKKLNVPIRIVHDVNEINDSNAKMQRMKRGAKGFYENGRITIILPNAESVEDVQQTLLHEAVAHYGLRKLVGEDNMDDFLDDVYKMVSDEIRKQIAADAIENYKGNVRIATEEYLARLAEQDIKPSVWDRIKEAFKKLLRKVGFNIEVNDNELNYILWRSKQNLEMSNPLDFAKDIAKQYETGTYFRTNISEGEEMKTPLEKDMREAWDRVAASNASLFKETVVDYLGSVEDFYKTVGEVKDIKDVKSYENAYYSLLALSSKNRVDMDNFDRHVSIPLNKAIAELTKDGVVKTGIRRRWDWSRGSLRDLVVYVEAKHGLERNRQMAVEVVANELNKTADKKNVEGKSDEATDLRERAKSILDTWQTDKENINNDMSLTFREKQDKLNDAATKTGADLGKDYSGLSAIFKDWQTDAVDNVEDYENNHNGRMLNALWGAIKTATEYSLQKQLQTGLVNKDYVNRQRKRFDYYIPLRGFADETAAEIYPYLDQAGRGIGSPVKTASGRVTEAGNPFGAILEIGYSSITTGNKNQAKQKFLNFVVNHKTNVAKVNNTWVIRYDELVNHPELKQVNFEIGEEIPEWVEAIPNIPDKTSSDDVAYILDKFDKTMDELKKDGKAKALTEKTKLKYRTLYGEIREHEIPVMVGGRKYTITIAGNPRVANAINGRLNPDTGNGVVTEIAKRVQNMMASAFTGKNAAFALANLSRDSMYANNQAFVRENPEYWWKFTKNQKMGIGRFKDTLVWLKDYHTNSLSLLDLDQKMFKEFMDNGGATGYTFMNNQKEFADKISKDLNELAKRHNVAQRVKDFVPDMFDLFEYVGQAAELVNRYAAYKTSREMGRDVSRSIIDAKEISVNFNKKGAGTKTIQGSNKDEISRWIKAAATISQYGRAGILFWNANLQSKYLLLQNFKQAPIKTLTTMVGNNIALGAFVIPLLSNVIIPVLFGYGDGDNDDDYYDALTDYERQHNICIRLPKGGWLKIPLSLEHAPFYAIGDVIGGALFGKREITAKDFTDNILDATIPISINHEYKGYEKLLNVLPTVTQPVMQVMMNVNFMGAPLKKEGFGYTNLDPEYLKVYKNTSSAMVQISKWVNEMSGGDDVESGFADFNPAYAQNLLNGYFGGFSQVGLSLADFIIGNESTSIKIAKMPVISRFYASGAKDMIQRRLDISYRKVSDFNDKMAHKINRYKKILTNPQTDSAVREEYRGKLKEFMQSDDYARYQLLKGYGNTVTTLKKSKQVAPDVKQLDVYIPEIQRMCIEILRTPEKDIESVRDKYTQRIKQQVNEINSPE